MLKAVIFDMDGVLIDSEPLHAKAAVIALKDYGKELPIEYCYNFIGSTTKHMLETIIKDYNLPVSTTELTAKYQEKKHRLIKEEGHIAVPFTKELIIDLYNHGVKLAIASSSTLEEIEDVVNQLDIRQYFDKLVSGATVKHPKPAPDIFIKAMNELGIHNKECIIIEDSSNGVRAANSANIPAIGFINKNSGNQDLSKAYTLIESFEEIDYEFIKNTYLHANDMPVTITKTDRLIIRELTVEDIPNLFTIYQNPEVTKYIDELDKSLDIEIEKHKAYIRNGYHFYGYGLWGVFEKETDKLIGRCGIQNTTIEDKIEIELGYLLDQNNWGNGYAIECAKATIDYAFNKLYMNRIVAVIDPFNIHSIRVAENIGMKLEKQIEKNGHVYNLYSINHELL